MNKGLVSICIPVYNCEKFISSTIDSILSQTYENYELIIVDNCSTDNTVKEILRYNETKIKYYNNDKNYGIEYNWNKAISLAKGEYVKLMPADDILGINCLEKQVDVLNSNKDVVLVGCNRDIINSNGKRILKPKKNYTNRKLTLDDLINLSIKSGSNPIGEPGSVLIRTDLLKKDKNFNNTYPYVIDLNFYFNYLNNGRFIILNDYLYSFRVSSSSLSVEISYKQREDFLNFIKSYLFEKSIRNRINILMKIRLNLMTFIKMIGRIFVYRLTNS
jgi:glycosyltransferase involved in cell wall biosynthesis